MLPAVGIVLVAAILLTLPGAVVGASLGLRGWLLLGCSPVLTLGAAAALTALTSALGIPWNPWTFTGLTLLLSVILATVCWPWRRNPPHPADRWALRHHLSVAGAVLVSGALGATAVFRGTLRLHAVQQAWDTPFHAGAVRRIAELHDADSSVLASVGKPASADFYYPDVYHALGALLYDLLPISTVQVIDAFSVVTPALFCLSMAPLLRALSPRPVFVVSGVILASAVPYFPTGLIAYGPLLPFALALAAAPAVVALVDSLLNRPRRQLVLALGLAATGLAATHPSVAVAIAIWCLAHVVLRVLILRRAGVAGLLGLSAAAILTALLLAPQFAALRASAAVSVGITNTPFESPGAAIGRLVVFNTNTAQPHWTLALLLVVGVALAIRMRSMVSVLAAGVAFATLYVWSAAYDTRLTHAITALWWDNPERLAALFAVPAIVLAALGLTAAVDLLARAAPRLRPQWLPAQATRLRALALAVTVLLFWLATDLAYSGTHVQTIRTNYGDGPMLSHDEELGLSKVAELTHGSGSILNDPFDGSGWGYALHDLPVLFATPVYWPELLDDWGADRATLLRSFNHIDTSPVVQDATARLGVRWVVLDRGFVFPDLHRQPGLTDLQNVAALTLVYDNGAVQLYRVNQPPA